MRTQVAIIGGGPSGLLLSQILQRSGIESVVVERHTRQHVLERIRAGVLEHNSVDLLCEAGVGERMMREGHPHDGVGVAWQGHKFFLIEVKKYTGKSLMAYGQTKITEDLYAARDSLGGIVIDEAIHVRPHEVTTLRPFVTFEKDNEHHRIDCDFIAGCDGFHGVSRTVIPTSVLRTYEKVYPFGWLGILSETPPLPNLTYANHERGFALASMRNKMLSRYYIQCDLSDAIEDWPDDRFWPELKSRFPVELAEQIVTGPSIEKSIAPLRSFVVEPMRYGRLYLAGDAAHIVPPTGAKGLNLAFGDVFYLSRALVQYYQAGKTDYLDCYSEMALRRVWSATRFSWWMTTMLHRFPNQGSFEQRAQEAELDYLASSERAQAAVCEQYGGMAFEQ